MKVALIVQARMSSTRLPGKVLKQVLQKPLLEYQIERLLRVHNANEVIIATTANKADQPIVDLCQRLSIPVYLGSEENVLGRYYGAAVEHQVDVVVRLTSDCPLIDPEVVDRTIQYFLDHRPKYDYVSNTLERSYPRGMDTEVFTFESLELAFREAMTQTEKEHVTPFLYKNSDRFRLGHVLYNQDISFHRWTVDTPEDFELVKRILEALYPQNPQFTMRDVLILLERNQEWVQLNSKIEQKKIDSEL